jgi:uncharacterized protein (TIGR00251 family)
MVIYLKVKPNQRFDQVEKEGDNWQIRLKAPAVDGKANEHLIGYLSDLLHLSKSRIRLKKGMTSRLKCLEIEMDEKLVYEKLEASINRRM